MNLLKRLNNLWKISGYHFTKYSVKDGIEFTKSPEGEKPHLAQIIKRETATEKLLKEIKENGI